jgi:uncharacterized protein
LNTDALMGKYFNDPSALDIVVKHSRLVASKALRIARALDRGEDIDLVFLQEAAILHDIGICRTNSPGIGCHGEEPYIRHGIIGREILEKEGFPHHALVCERHIGVGLTRDDIVSQRLPLPLRDMTPVTIEEKIISFADLFYSKNPGSVSYERKIEEIKTDMKIFGKDKLSVLENWIREFGGLI